jgi:hypothetical protein
MLSLSEKIAAATVASISSSLAIADLLPLISPNLIAAPLFASSLLNVRGGSQSQPASTTSNSPLTLTTIDNAYQRYHRLPVSFRFMTAGIIGNASFFLLEKCIYKLLCRQHHHDGSILPALVLNYKESASFFVAYLIQILPQHFLNAVLCYGLDTIDSRQKYLTTLFGTYSA